MVANVTASNWITICAPPKQCTREAHLHGRTKWLRRRRSLRLLTLALCVVHAIHAGCTSHEQFASVIAATDAVPHTCERSETKHQANACEDILCCTELNANPLRDCCYLVHTIRPLVVLKYDKMDEKHKNEEEMRIGGAVHEFIQQEFARNVPCK